MIAPAFTISWKLLHVSGRWEGIREGLYLSRMYPFLPRSIAQHFHHLFTTFLSFLESWAMPRGWENIKGGDDSGRIERMFMVANLKSFERNLVVLPCNYRKAVSGSWDCQRIGTHCF